ncbi:MAG: hypothetical protein Q9Q40_07450 [Acidobacteriota bacterium]|nr:hypothetical protein [Acidobacteriota bacterium]MDQ7087945.1 hypothetical protein [Acidobacteriota bacterium]
MAARLGEWLIENGQLTREQLDEALRSQAAFGGALGTRLVQLGFIDEGVVGQALAALHGVESVDRQTLLSAPPELTTLLSEEFCRRHHAVPFSVEGEDLRLAIQNPADSLAIHEAAFLTGFNVIPHVAPEILLNDALGQFFGRGTADTTPQGPPRRTPPSPPAATPVRTFSLEETGRRLARAESRDEVLEIALEALSHFFPRGAALALRDGRATILTAFGSDRPGGDWPAWETGSGDVFEKLAADGEVIEGPLPDAPGNRELLRRLGGETWPGAVAVLPITVRGRLVAALYADRPKNTPAGAPPLEALAASVSLALEAILLRQKILRTCGS